MSLVQDRRREQEEKSRRAWVLSLVFLALVFDGYDLVVYGTVVPTFLKDPTQLGPVTPEVAGALGSYALIGVMVGALLTGAVSDILGRRKVVLIALAWFSIGMGLTALAQSTAVFGLLRFVTGIGVGSLVATVGAVAAEFAPPGKRNIYVGIAYSGVPFGAMMAAVAALFLLEPLGWRGLFWVGALPIVTLLPLVLVKMPESPLWLATRGRRQEAQTIAASMGLALPAETPALAAGTKPARAGFASLATEYALPTFLLGFMSFSGLLLTYGLNTWLPKMMEDNGYAVKSSLAFLLLLNAGAVVGAVVLARVADRFGPKYVVATTFLVAALTIALLTLKLPLALLYVIVAFAGLGTLGTQVLIYGFVANYYKTQARGAGVAWCAGFGRLGGIGGPLLGGFLIGAGIGTRQIFLTFAGVAFVGMLLAVLVPKARLVEALKPVPVRGVAANGSAGLAAQP